MNARPIYLDNQATTRVDPRVVEAMLPYFTDHYGNAGSLIHTFGEEARAAVHAARASIAHDIGAQPEEIIFTSGATESNNLALRGAAERRQARGRHIVSVVSEHRSVLDPLRRLQRGGFEVTWLGVEPQGSREAGRVSLDQFQAALRPDTILVSVMLANNEIGVIQPIAEIGAICREREIWFHCDATQGIGKSHVYISTLSVDMLSFSAHKMYGPKGIGALYVRRGPPAVRLSPLIDGGGQERGLRSGTLNVAGIVGFATALRICQQEMEGESARLGARRDELLAALRRWIPDLQLNGPLWEPDLRLPGNLNLQIPAVDGEALMLQVPHIAISSGSACSSTDPHPSHVLAALGLSEVEIRSSLRVGVGRFNSAADIQEAADALGEAARRLRELL